MMQCHAHYTINIQSVVKVKASKEYFATNDFIKVIKFLNMYTFVIFDRSILFYFRGYNYTVITLNFIYETCCRSFLL